MQRDRAMMGDRPVLLRVLTGRVAPERVDDVLARGRGLLAGDAPPFEGLVGTVAGTRRMGDALEVVVITAWRPPEVSPTLAGAGVPAGDHWFTDVVAGVRTDHYEALVPPTPGLVDTPTSVLRMASARFLRGRETAATAWIRHVTEMLGQFTVAMYVGRRLVGGHLEIFMGSVWPDRATLEAVAGSADPGRPLIRTRDDLFRAFQPDHYSVLNLRPPAALGGRVADRLLVARFADPETAERAVGALAGRVGDPAAVAIAELGSTDYATPRPGLRIVTVRHAGALQVELERLVDELGGLVLSNRPAPDGTVAG